MNMKKKYWRDIFWFAAGTFLGGMVLGLLGGIVGSVKKVG